MLIAWQEIISLLCLQHGPALWHWVFSKGSWRLWERAFKSWATKIRYRKPCPSLMVLNQTQGSFQGKMNFPVPSLTFSPAGIPANEWSSCTDWTDTVIHWSQKQLHLSSGEKATLRVTDPCVTLLREYQKSGTCYFSVKLWFLFACMIFIWWQFCAVHITGTHGNWLCWALLWVFLPPGNLLASQTANPAREPTCKELSTTTRLLPASLRR